VATHNLNGDRPERSLVRYASANALVNLVESGVLTQEWVDEYLKSAAQTKEGHSSSSLASEKIV
jgi:hypothetical protein